MLLSNADNGTYKKSLFPHDHSLADGPPAGETAAVSG